MRPVPGQRSALPPAGPPVAEAVRLHAAGSLESALRALAQAFAATYGVAVDAQFGASGLLCERLRNGEAGDVFAAAGMRYPLALARRGRARPAVLFARNRLCAIARPGLSLVPATVLRTMLDPSVRLATSTPGAAAGDYARESFRKAETVQPGSRARLEAKALQLTGGPASPRPPAGRNVHAWHLAEGRADLFLTYATSGRDAAAALPGATVVDLPPPLATEAEYGLTVLGTANPAPALALFSYILSPDGQAILARHGFEAPLLPRRP